ncbi:DUF7666 domain-containing protein [Sphingopyxis indica]|uniref:DUF7666 domain-containing protein n=1 Tax=Sphingopyxis indica TaxID=436663 RepID=A0A239KQV2_9SPHN|nr:hypothetical protein [Sphingopyxis indica]SNT20058.1 hypothetical protein SAMN06295955_11591 [Sphingopyxis indica]
MAAKKKPAEITAYKAFDKNLSCRGFQYEVGKTYEHDGAVIICSSGFHACENPLDVLNYYDLIDSRFAIVKASGEISHQDGDSKIASAKITVEAELKLPEFIGAAVNWMIANVKGKESAASGYGSKLAASGYDSKLAASGYGSKLAASGYYSKLAASGNDSNLAASGCGSNLAASGNDSKLAASGNDSNLAASGYGSKLAASGDYSKLAASGYGSNLAASGYGSNLAASGYYSKLAASGNYSKLAASGNDSNLAASGDYSNLAASGYDSKAKAGENGAIALAYHDGKRARFAVGYVGEDGIKADTWYRADASTGKLVEAA